MTNNTELVRRLRHAAFGAEHGLLELLHEAADALSAVSVGDAEPVAWMVTRKADKTQCIMAWCKGGVYTDPQAWAEYSAKMYQGTVTPLYTTPPDLEAAIGECEQVVCSLNPNSNSEQQLLWATKVVAAFTKLRARLGVGDGK